MVDRTQLTEVESRVYRDSWSDGLIDAFLGLSLIWMGVTWLWVPALAPFAGLLPAALAPPVILGRARIVEARRGWVRWTPQREQRQQGALLGGVAAGVGLLVVTVLGISRVGGGGSISDALAPGILAWLVALLVLGLYVVMQTRRMLAYAATLAVAGAVTAATDANPGWPLLAAGVVVVAVATPLVVQLVHKPPRSA